jgi:Lar family restriction alleviation protein
MSELKSCPYCGRKAENPDYERTRFHDIEWRIECEACPAEIAGCSTEKEAIKAWNTRVPSE